MIGEGEILVIDDFVSLEYQEKIKQELIGLENNFPWHYTEDITGAGEYDKLGRMFEVTYESLGQISARETQGFGTLTDTAVSNITQQPKDQPSNIVPTQPTSRMQQAIAQLNVSPPSAASSAGGINPLLVTNPLTRATFGSP